MKRLYTMISYNDLFSIAKRGGKAKGTPAFIELFKPALKESFDDTIEMLVCAVSFSISTQLFSNSKLEAIHILIIQEYIQRVEKSEKEEQEVALRLEELKKEVRKEEWYRQIVEKEDSSILNNIELQNLVDKKMHVNQALAGRNLDEHLRWTAIYEAALHQFIYNQERRRQAPENRFSFDIETNPNAFTAKGIKDLYDQVYFNSRGREKKEKK